MFLELSKDFYLNINLVETIVLLDLYTISERQDKGFQYVFHMNSIDTAVNDIKDLKDIPMEAIGKNKDNVSSIRNFNTFYVSDIFIDKATAQEWFDTKFKIYVLESFKTKH